MAELNNHSARPHALLSASSSARWLACPPSARAAELYPNVDTEYTKEGTLAHEVAEMVARGAPNLAKFLQGSGSVVNDEMIECARGYADYIASLRGRESVVFYEQRVDFSHWVPEGFGTTDCIVVSLDSAGAVLDVIDYKYGKGVAVSAQKNSQLMLYGLGAWNAAGWVWNVTRVRLHIYQPRLNNVDVFELSLDQLLTWGESIRPTAQNAYAGKGEMSAGEHCRFCPHAGACPALAKYCSAAAHQLDSDVSVPTLAPWEVADILKNEPVITAWLNAVKTKALADMLDGGTVPGFKVVAGRARRTWADETEAARALSAAGYGVEDYTKTEVLSPYNLEKALGKKRVAELLSGHILTMPGSPTLAPENDKRPVYDRMAEARKDFDV